MISSVLKIPYNRDPCENVTFFFTFPGALPVSSESVVRIGNRFGMSLRTTTIDIKLFGMFCGRLGVIGALFRGPALCSRPRLAISTQISDTSKKIFDLLDTSIKSKNQGFGVQNPVLAMWTPHYAVRLWHCDNASVSTESAPAELRDYQSITKHPYTLYIDRSCPKGHTKSIPSVYSTSRSHQEHPGKSKKKTLRFRGWRNF